MRKSPFSLKFVHGRAFGNYREDCRPFRHVVRIRDVDIDQRDGNTAKILLDVVETGLIGWLCQVA